MRLFTVLLYSCSRSGVGKRAYGLRRIGINGMGCYRLVVAGGSFFTRVCRKGMRMDLDNAVPNGEYCTNLP